MKRTNRDNPPKKETPSVAPGLELDELEVKASEKEIADGNYTEVTKLFLDRID